MQFFEDPAEHWCELLFKGAKLCPQWDKRAQAQTQTCTHARTYGCGWGLCVTLR